MKYIISAIIRKEIRSIKTMCDILEEHTINF